MKSPSQPILRLLSGLGVLCFLSGCARPVLVWDGVFFPGWLIAIALAIPPAVLLGRPIQRRVAPDRRWTREPIEIAVFIILFVAFYFLLVWPDASAP